MHPPYAGFWLRFAGYLLDGLLYGLLFVPFAIAAGVLGFQAFDDCYTVENRFDGTTELRCPDGAPEGGPLAAAIIIGLIGLVVVMFIYLRALAKSGQTWGRKIVGVKVVKATTGLAPGWGAAIGRTLFAYFISANICYLGYLWMLWDKQKQTWQDKVAGTIVIKAN